MNRPLIFPLLMWLCIVFGLITLLLTAGCTPVPYCEKYQAMLGSDQNGQPVLAMSMDQVETLGKVMKGLNAGTCKLDLGGV